MNSSAVTTFTVFPGGGSLGRISTAWDGAGGIGGLFEQLFAPTVLRAIYAGELKRLDTCARPPFPVSPPHTVGGRTVRSPHGAPMYKNTVGCSRWTITGPAANYANVSVDNRAPIRRYARP